MPQDNPIYVDIFDYIAQQRGERYQSFIVHGPPLVGKSDFAQKVAERAGGAYLDVMAIVAADDDLASRVDTIDAAWLESLVRQQIEAGADLVVVDEFDWLWPIWNGDLTPLLRIIERFYPPQPAVVIWVMPTNRALEDAKIARASGVSRVLALDEIAELK